MNDLTISLSSANIDVKQESLKKKKGFCKSLIRIRANIYPLLKNLRKFVDHFYMSETSYLHDL